MSRYVYETVMLYRIKNTTTNDSAISIGKQATYAFIGDGDRKILLSRVEARFVIDSLSKIIDALPVEEDE